MKQFVKSIMETIYNREISAVYFLKAALLFFIVFGITIVGYSQSGGWDGSGTNGTAGYNDYGNGVIQLLNTASAGCASAAVHERTSTYDPSSGEIFNKCYQVYFGCPGGDDIGSDTKGDGLAFSFSKCAYNINSGLTCGGGLGYMGACSKMITIEFDTWSSQSNSGFDGSYGGGTTGNHDEIALHRDGDASDVGRITSVDAGNLEDGLEHSVCISYNPSSHILSVSIDGTTMLSYDFTGSPYDLPVYFGAGGLNQTWSSGKYGATNPATVSNGANIASTVGGPLCPAGVVITSPANGATFEICDGPVAITASVTPPAGNTVSYVEFFIDGVSIGMDNSLPYAISWDNPSSGNHSITATSHYLPSGTTSTSTPVAITIEDGIALVASAPLIDGTMEALWDNQTSHEITKVTVGTVSSAADLSATFKIARDADNLYVIVNVTDDDLRNDGGDNWENDGVELFIDIGNDKSSVYGANDFQYAFVYKSTTVTEYKHGAIAGITFQQGTIPNGYSFEIRIPWTTLGGTPAAGDLIGFDLHLNDDDGGGARESKMAWHDGTDNAWNSPSVFGTLKLSSCNLCPVADAGNNQSVCNLSTVNLNAVAVSMPASGSWSFVSGPSTPEIVTKENASTSVNQLIPGTYVFQWAVTQANCQPSESQVTVVNSEPLVSNSGTDQIVCNVTSVQLNAEAVSAPSSAEWTLVSGPNTPTIVAANNAKSNVTGLISGTYVFKWTVSKNNCTAAESEVSIVNNIPVTSNSGLDQNICNATTAQLNATAVSAPSSAQWSLVNGPNTPTIESSTNAQSNITGLVTGTYVFRWTVTTPGCTPSESEVTIVNNVSPVSNSGTDQTVCNVAIAQLDAIVVNAPSTASWSLVSGPNTPTIETVNDAKSNVSGLIPGSYTFKWTVNTPGCSPQESEVTIVNNIPVSSNSGLEQDICNATTAQLNAVAVSAPSSAQWSLVSGPNTPTIESSTNAQSNITGLVTGTYVFRWTVTTPGCTPSESEVRIVNNASAVAKAGFDQALCNVSSAQLQALEISVPATGIWTLISGPNTPTIVEPDNHHSDVTGLTTGTYTFRWSVTNGACGTAFSEVIIINSVKPASVFAGDDQPFLCSDNTVLSASVPAAGTTGAWHVISGNAVIEDVVNPSSAVTNIAAGTITLEWVISSGTCDPARDTIVLSRTPDISVAVAGSDRNICQHSVKLNGDVVAVGSGKWSSSDEDITFDDVHDPKTMVSGLKDGLNQIVWTVTGQCGNHSSDVVIINVGASTLSIEANASADTLCSGSETTVTAIASGSDATPFIYTWTSSDGSISKISEESVISVTPSMSGWISYLVSVVDSNGCSVNSPALDSVYVISQQSLIIPSLITPNGDDKNDCLIIKDDNHYDIMPGSVFELYNRWGQAVYRNNFYQNGDFCGSELSDGLYFYTIQTSCDRREINGWLEIISNK